MAQGVSTTHGKDADPTSESKTSRSRYCDDGIVIDSIMATHEGKRAELEAELAQMSASLGEAGAISFGKRVGSMAVERW